MMDKDISQKHQRNACTYAWTVPGAHTGLLEEAQRPAYLVVRQGAATVGWMEKRTGVGWTGFFFYPNK